MTIAIHSYSFRHYPIRHVFAVAKHLGYDAVDLQPCHLELDRLDGSLDEALELARSHGVAVSCVGYHGDFVTDDPARRERAIDAVGAILRACGRRGIPMVNGIAGLLVVDPADWRKNGTKIAQPQHYERAAEAFRSLAVEARAHGVKICVEVHPDTVHDTVAGMARLLEPIGGDTVMATVDPANAITLSEGDRDPDVVDRLAGRIGYYHLKNAFVRDGRCDFNTVPSLGEVDNYRWLQKLARMGELPAIAVEYCGNGDPHPTFLEGRRYVERCLDLGARRRRGVDMKI